MSDISQQEVWLRAYCAVISGRVTHSYFITEVARDAKEQAAQAVEDFFEKFPPFQFASEENKTITVPTDPIA